MTYEVIPSVEGYWTREGELAVFVPLRGDRQAYNQNSLEAAIQNVTKNRNWYANQAAYLDHLRHYQSGIALLKNPKP